jgi:hypothetical protein
MSIKIITKQERKLDKPVKKELKPMPAVVHKKKPAFEKIRKAYEVRVKK